MISIRLFALLTAAGVLFTSCDGPTEPTPIASIEVTAPTTTLVSGASVQLTAVARSRSGESLNGRVITWSSTNQAAATVSPTGLVTAANVLGGVEEAGSLIASAEGITGFAVIRVNPVPVAMVTNTSLRRI